MAINKFESNRSNFNNYLNFSYLLVLYSNKESSKVTADNIVPKSETDQRIVTGSIPNQTMPFKEEIIDNASATTNHLQEQVVTPDPADRATLEEEYALELRTRDRERKLLTKVQASLRQIEDGSYGFCKDTDEPIGLKRLLARPTANLSVEAQERREQVKKQFAD